MKDDEEDSGEEDDDDEDEDESMFERICDLYEIRDGSEISLGRVNLKIVYDDDVYGARIIAVLADSVVNGSSEEDDSSDDFICNHIIAMQTVLNVDSGNQSCSWSAFDFSANPRYRNFKASFKNYGDDADEVQVEFASVFNEGKELAEQSEILEQPASAGNLNPEEMYYGQGGEYDDEDDSQ